MPKRKLLLIVDDDRDLNLALTEQLAQGEEFATISAFDGRSALELAKTAQPSLIVLDVEMPDMNGFEVCAKLRAEGFTAPVLMLTGRADDADTVEGLNAGANDYVLKPFRLSVLLARIRAHLRSFEQSEDAVLHVGHFEFRPGTKVLIDPKGKKTRLTEKESNILKYLYRQNGAPVSREELLREVWGYNPSVTTHTLETHIYRLRRKIEPSPQTAQLLITEPGGYRLARIG